MTTQLHPAVPPLRPIRSSVPLNPRRASTMSGAGEDVRESQMEGSTARASRSTVSVRPGWARSHVQPSHNMRTRKAAIFHGRTRRRETSSSGHMEAIALAASHTWVSMSGQASWSMPRARELQCESRLSGLAARGRAFVPMPFDIGEMRDDVVRSCD